MVIDCGSADWLMSNSYCALLIVFKEFLEEGTHYY